VRKMLKDGRFCGSLLYGLEAPEGACGPRSDPRFVILPKEGGEPLAVKMR
jgi:hypothetical protein